jgi:hypothetical protein
MRRDAGCSVRAEGSYRVIFWSGAIEGEAEGLIAAAGPAPQRFETSDVDDNPSATWIDFHISVSEPQAMFQIKRVAL